MPTAMYWYGVAAQQFGGVDPNDDDAVDDFFVVTIQTLPKEKRDEVVRFLLNHDGVPEPEETPRPILPIDIHAVPPRAAGKPASALALRDQLCPFCNPSRKLLIETDLVAAFEDLYPVSPGHVLVVPRRHVATYFDCTDAEKSAIWTVVEEVRAIIDMTAAPDGYNVGFNAGRAAGQTIDHAHVHVIPRYEGDVADPRGGVRHAVIGRG